MLPDFPEFASRPIPNGREYHVHGLTRCVAYHIADTETLRPLGAVEGVIAYAFVEYARDGGPRQVGHWYGVFHSDDLLEALEVTRAAADPTAPRPRHRPLRELIEERLRPRPQYRIDVDDLNR